VRGIGLNSIAHNMFLERGRELEVEKFMESSRTGRFPPRRLGESRTGCPQMVKITRASLVPAHAAPPLSFPPSQRLFVSLVSPPLPPTLQHSRVDILHIDNSTLLSLDSGPSPASVRLITSPGRVLDRCLRDFHISPNRYGSKSWAPDRIASGRYSQRMRRESAHFRDHRLAHRVQARVTAAAR